GGRVMTTQATEARSSVTTAPETALRVRDLVVRYGRGKDALRAVDHVNIDVPRGHTLGIIGESGSGKSTLIKAIAGLAPVTEGTIEIADESGTLRPVTSSVGRGGEVQMIFQDPVLALNSLRPVWQSVAEPMEPGKLVVPRRLRERAVELLEQV